VSVVGGCVSVVGGCVVGGNVVGGCVVGGCVVGGKVVGGCVVGGKVVGGCVVGGGSVSVVGGRLGGGGGSVGGGGGSVPGSGWNVDGKLFGLLALTGVVRVLISGGRSVVKPNGVTTAPNNRWSFCVIVWLPVEAAGWSACTPCWIAMCVLEPCGALASAPVCAVRTFGPATLALLWPPGRMNATNATIAKTTPATSIVASSCSSVLRPRTRRNQ
jgi:hypothetical protein